MAKVILEKRENIATMRIERPESLNALNKQVVDEIDAAIRLIASDKDVRVLVIHSKDNFAAGADIKEMINCTPEEADSFAFSPTFNKIASLSIPTLAVIEGYALGGGLELALTCDLRIAARDAKLGFPEVGLGIMPGAGGNIRAPRLIGEAKSKEMIMLGTIISGEKAEEIGLINAAVDRDKVEELAYKWTKKLAAAPPIAIVAAKQTIEAGLEEKTIAKGVGMEQKRFAELFNTEDQKEGMRAFTEKRKPNYVGR